MLQWQWVPLTKGKTSHTCQMLLSHLGSKKWHSLKVCCCAGRVYTNAAAVGAIAQREGIPYLLDATQSVGQMPIDVQELGCDYLVSTGRKFLRAPRGTGLLFASR